MSTTFVVGASAAKVNLEWVRGDAHEWQFTLTDDQGDPLDISGGTFVAEMKRGVTKWSFGVDVATNGANGVLRLSAPTDADLPRRGRWDLRQSGPVTLMRGTVKLLPEISEVP